jgi:hypothetical protein
MKSLDFSLRLGVDGGCVDLLDADEREECSKLVVVKLAAVVT